MRIFCVSGRNNMISKKVGATVQVWRRLSSVQEARKTAFKGVYCIAICTSD